MKKFGIFLVALMAAASAQQPTAKPASRPVYQDPSLVAVADEPGLPRVLLIGDSISMGYTLPVRTLLKGKANLHRIPDNGGSTKDGLTHLDAWLGDGKWNVIHFNWGLHDLKHMKDGKLDLTGERISTPAEYEANLRVLVKRLQATGARLIWASTTPVPAGADGRVAGDELAYNEAAMRVMKDRGVQVNDLHALCLPHLADWQQAHNVHFQAAGCDGLAAGVASMIESALQPPGASHAIPAELPRPDGRPGDPAKPVKVYVLAGQSNMVGMGDLTGTRPVYPSVFLSADPAVVPGPMPIGRSVLAAHGVYQSAEANAAKGAKASLYQGACDPKTDYSKLTPVKTATVELGTVARNLPALDGPCTVVVNAFIDVPASGSYIVHAGFEVSACSVAVLDGKEVYRKEPGGKAVFTKVALDQGKRYPVAITYFKGGSAAFWLEQVDLEVKGDLETVTKKTASSNI